MTEDSNLSFPYQNSPDQNSLDQNPPELHGSSGSSPGTVGRKLFSRGEADALLSDFSDWVSFVFFVTVFLLTLRAK